MFGTVLLGRMNAGAGADRIPGPFMNTLPVRVQVDSAAAGDAVVEMQRQLAGLLLHEHAPLALAQQASGVTAPAPLFTSLLNYRHVPAHSDPQAGGQRRAGRHREPVLPERTNFPLTAAVDDNGSGFGFVIQAVAPADPTQVGAWLQTAVASLVAALEDETHGTLRTIDVLAEAERRQLLITWNDTARGLPAATVPELFATQVRRVPDAVAVACGDAALSYQELDAAAERLAQRLLACGVGAEQVVAVVMDRGIALMTALLAVLKAGAAYLPVDPSYPPERIAFMLADARPAVIMAARASLMAVPGPLRTPVLLADEPAPSHSTGRSGSQLIARRQAHAAVDGQPCVRDLYLGIDGTAERGGGLTCWHCQSGRGTRPVPGGGDRAPDRAVRLGEL